MANSVLEVIQRVEELIAGYQVRQTDRLINGKLDDEELREIRGTLHACRDLLPILRSNLGYDPETI